MPGDHEALQRGLKSVRADHGYKSDRELAQAAGVHLQTLQNWMSGKTTPRPSELSKVARVLDRPLDYFMALYEGRNPEPPPLMQRLDTLTAAILDLVAEIREERDAAERYGQRLAAAEALRFRADDESRAKRSAPRGTKG